MATAPWCDCLEVSVHLGDKARSISEGEGGLLAFPASSTSLTRGSWEECWSTRESESHGSALEGQHTPRKCGFRLPTITQ